MNYRRTSFWRLRSSFLIALLGSLTVQAQVPVINGLLPVRNQNAASVSNAVTVSFSQPMQNTVVTQQAVRIFSQQRGGLMFGSTRGIATVSGNTINFDPIHDFKPGETLYVTTTTGATAVSGTPLAHGYVHQFTTATGGTGTGTFVPGAHVLDSLGLEFRSIVVGDIDSDGDLDVIVGDLFNGTARVCFNNGRGSFSSGRDAGTGDTSYLSLADVDGDGDLDLVSTTYNGIIINLNDGNGVFFGNSSVYVGSGDPLSLVVCDIDGDGDLDLLTPTYDQITGNSTVAVCRNDGAGNFTPTDISQGTTYHSIATGDIDADGDLDLLFSENTNVNVWLNGGDASGSNTGNFSNGSSVMAAGGIAQITLADVDADGDLDLLAANGNASTTATVSVRLNDGLGIFSGAHNVPIDPMPTGISVNDLDADGDLDLLVTSLVSGAVNVRFNNGVGNFSGTTGIPVGDNLYAISTGDMDGDGDVDFVCPLLAHSAGLWLNGGTPLGVGSQTVRSASLCVAPNPMSTSITLRITGGVADQPLALLDATGRRIASIIPDATGTATLAPATLYPGFYLLRAADGRTQRLVVE